MSGPPPPRGSGARHADTRVGTRDDPDTATPENAFYDIARWRLDEQRYRVDALDTRVANMLYLIAALAPLFGALFVFSDTEGVSISLYVLAVVVYFLVVVRTVLA